jgi:serine/threonine protein kinase
MECKHPISTYRKADCDVIYYDLVNCSINFAKYVIVQEVGIDKGTTAVVFKVYNKEIGYNTIVKIQVGELIDSAINETKIGCLVSNLSGFVTLVNYWMCNDAPENWRHTQSITKQEESFWSFPSHFYLEMETYEGDLEELLIRNKNPISLDDKLSIWIELIRSLIQAYTAYNFAHNDIKLANIFYKIVQTPRKYTIGDTLITTNSIYYPVWGDFGLSRIGPDATHRDDVIFIGNMMIVHKKGLNLPSPYKEEISDLYVTDTVIVDIKSGFSYEKLLNILIK